MKYSVAAVIAAAAGAMATNVTVTTEVVTAYTTFCPAPTEITHGTLTYTVTEPTTLTITDCPCTVTKPIITTSSVICHDCPTSNGTIPGVPPPTGSPTMPTESPEPPIPTGAAAKAGLSGLAGLVGVAAFFL